MGNRISVGWGAFFVFLYFYRCGISVFGEFVVARFTSLGDSTDYQRRTFELFETSQSAALETLLSSGSTTLATTATRTLGGLLHVMTFGQPILINFGFQTVAFVGIYKFLSAVDMETRRYLAVLILSPSFNLWSSVAGKEALVVFFVGTLCAYIVKLYNDNFKFGPIEIISAVGVAVFKIHYVPALVIVFFLTITGKYIKQKVALAILTGLLSLVPLFLLRDKFDRLAFAVLPHFRGLGSSRDDYWIEKYDIFLKAPYGMIQGFFGPTWNESMSGPMQMASFFESFCIIGVMFLLFFRNLPDLPVFSLIVGVIFLSWLLFGSYPLGIMNGGSAIRYRTGYLLLVFLVFAVVFSREYYLRWLGEIGDQKSEAPSPNEIDSPSQKDSKIS